MLELDEAAVKATDESVAKETDEATTAPAVDEEETTKESPETKEPEKESVKEATDEYFDDILPLEGDERGKFYLPVGDSTYYGQTKKEVIQNLIKGKTEQDVYIRKVKASEKVKVPAPVKEKDITGDIPNEQDLYDKHINSVTRQNNISPEMLRFGREDWNRYQDDNQLRDYEIAELRQTVRETINKARELTSHDMAVANVAFINNTVIDQETDAVRDMLATSGIDQEKFDYEKVLEVATKKLDKNGVLIAGSVTSEAAKEILRIIKQSTPVKKDLSKEVDKGKKAKAEIKSPTSASKVEKEDDGKPKSFDEISREVKKSLGRSGREI